MTVIVLDPLRPTMIPMAALGLLGGGVRFTDEVPEATRTLLVESDDAALLVESPDAAVLVTTDADQAVVRERIAAGAQVIAAPQVPGDNLTEAVEVMDRLWSYGGWEVTQTHRSLAHYLVEETYEALDAIEAADSGDLREELGDLLLQVLFHSRIAQASAGFTVDDVAAALVAKLVHRSPHLAEDVVGPIDVAEQERAWEVRKAAEKARSSCVDGIALSQPAVGLVAKVIARAGKAGLPAELVPAELTVEAEAVAAAEAGLRVRAAAFIAEIRQAEAAARRDGFPVLGAADWARYWPAV